MPNESKDVFFIVIKRVANGYIVEDLCGEDFICQSRDEVVMVLDKLLSYKEKTKNAK